MGLETIRKSFCIAERQLYVQPKCVYEVNLLDSQSSWE